MRSGIVLVLVFGLSCATTPVAPPAVAPRISADVLANRLAEADRLASQGCYLCLKEAAAAYAALLEVSDDPVLIRNALENNLMIALREIELRLPDSGAREAAIQLQARVPASYASYVAALDALDPAKAGQNVRELYVRGEPVQFGSRQEREARAQLATELETEWPASPMKAYFYLSMAFSAGMIKELKPQLDAILEHTCAGSVAEVPEAGFSSDVFGRMSRVTLIGQETGFGEVHFLLGQRAILDANLGNAHRELTRARELLPDSAAISLVLANVTLAYARYAEALTLFERVLARGRDDTAEIGRAKALSYLRRHERGHRDAR